MRMRLPWRDRCQHVPFVGIEVVIAVWILLLQQEEEAAAGVVVEEISELGS